MTTIGSQTTVEGRIEGDEDITVEGRVIGTIALTETLFVAQQGSIDGSIAARGVRVDGLVEGDISATEFIHLTSTARVRARLTAPLIRMDDGAALSGDVEMDVESPTPNTRIDARPATRPQLVSRPAPVVKPTPASTPRPTPAPAPRPTPAPEVAAHEATPTQTVVTVVEEASHATSLDAYDAMTVKELRDRLKEHDLPVSGTKQELMERLHEAEA